MTVLSFWAPASHIPRIVVKITIVFIKCLLFDYTMLFDKHNVLEVLRQLWCKYYPHFIVEETDAQRSSRGQWMTELGLGPGLADSGALITSLIALVETQPLLLMQNATEVTASTTRMSAHSPTFHGFPSPKSLYLSMSVALSPETSWTLLIQATQDTSSGGCSSSYLSCH